jgi:hypothetical protein
MVEDHMGLEVEVWYRKPYENSKRLMLNIKVLACILGTRYLDGVDMYERFGLNPDNYVFEIKELSLGLRL